MMTSIVREIRHTFERTGSLIVTLRIENTLEASIYNFPIDVYEEVALGDIRVKTTSPLMSRTPIDFTVDVISGSDLKFSWFVNQQKVADTLDPRTDITFDHADTYQVRVTAVNAFSNMEAVMAVQIVAPIRGN